MKKNKFSIFFLYFLIIVFLISGYFLLFPGGVLAVYEYDEDTRTCRCPDLTEYSVGSAEECANTCRGHEEPPEVPEAEEEKKEKETAIAKFEGFAKVESPAEFFGLFIRIAIVSALGIITLIQFFVAGMTWLTSGGNPDRIKKAKDRMVWAFIGLAVTLASYALVDLIIKAFGG